MGTKIADVAQFFATLDDTNLVDNLKSLCDILGVSRSICRPLFVQYTLGIGSFYEVLVGILGHWLNLAGPDANIPNLSRLLKESEFVNASGTLRLLADFNNYRIYYPKL